MKAARQLVIVLLVLICLISLYVSIHLVTDTTGASLGFPFYLLNGTALADYLIPGIFLFFFGFVCSALTLFAMVKRLANYPMLIMLNGLIIFLFLLVLVIYLGEGYLLEYVFMAIGIILASLGVLMYKQLLDKQSTNAKLVVKQTAKSHHHKHRKH